MKPRFLMSHRRKNLVRDKVIGKKWTYLERNTVHRQSVGHLRRQEVPQNGVVSFYGLGNFIGLMSGRTIPTISGEGAGISRNWATAHFLPFYGWPPTVRAPAGVI